MKAYTKKGLREIKDHQSPCPTSKHNRLRSESMSFQELNCQGQGTQMQREYTSSQEALQGQTSTWANEEMMSE